MLLQRRTIVRESAVDMLLRERGDGSMSLSQHTRTIRLTDRLRGTANGTAQTCTWQREKTAPQGFVSLAGERYV